MNSNCNHFSNTWQPRKNLEANQAEGYVTRYQVDKLSNSISYLDEYHHCYYI